MTTHRRRTPARAAAESPLRGWGLAVLSVAAAVTAVPLAITAVANDRSDDPLPTVDTFTAGSPQALPDGATGSTGSRRGTTEVSGDQSTAGVFGGPQPGAPAAPAPAPVVVPVPQPAAVVRPTTPVVPTAITPREATPPTTTKTTPTKTSTDDGDDGRDATKPTTPKSTSSPKPTSSDNGGQKKDKGLVGTATDTVGGVVGGVGRVASGLL